MPLRTATNPDPPSPSRRVPSAGRSRVVFCAAALLSVACAGTIPHRTAGEFPAQWREIETITLVPPKVTVYAMTAGGVEEEVGAWTTEAERHIEAAIEQEVTGRFGRRFVPYAGTASPHARGNGPRAAAGPGTYSRPEQVWLLFEAVRDASLRHAYDPVQAFPDHVQRFGYTLGPGVRELLGSTRADACLLVIASDHVATRDRAALVLAGLAAMPLSFSYAGPSATPAALVLALVDARSGEILFFSRVSDNGVDLRDATETAALIRVALGGIAP